MDGEVVLDKLVKKFDPRPGEKGPAGRAVDSVSLTVKAGEFLVVVGPSGCGKSTTLRIVAGLAEPDGGTVSISGRPMNGVPPQERDVAMVFQSYALYPQMTVQEILEFPLKMRGVEPKRRREQAREAAEILRIERLLARRPGELSGGERQRVAMGRAIVRRPKVFLFDEPLSNLDAALRSDLRVEIGSLVRRLGSTAIYVTHDQVEAMTLADRIAVMQKGKLLQLATAREIYERPASTFVGTFLGSPRMNVLPGRVADGLLLAGPFRLSLGDVAMHAGGELPETFEVGVRAEDMAVGEAAGERPDAVRGEVVAVEPLGAESHLVVRVGAGSERSEVAVDLRIRADGFAPFARGDRIPLALSPSQVHLFDPTRDGARIN